MLSTRIAWDTTPVTVSANEVVAALSGGDGGKTLKAEAVEFLEDALAGGPMAVSEVQAAARKAGITSKSLRSAREALRIKPEKLGMDQGWVWRLPKMPSTPEDARQNERTPSDPEGTFGVEA